jgi:hypothetical protein
VAKLLLVKVGFTNLRIWKEFKNPKRIKEPGKRVKKNKKQKRIKNREFFSVFWSPNLSPICLLSNYPLSNYPVNLLVNLFA